MTLVTPFQPLILPINRLKTYGWVLFFVGGNILFPQLCHLVPQGGLIWLPIYFFTLLAAYKFGIKAGLLTAILSPVVNSLLFGMPALAVLPVLLIKSSFLAIAAAAVAQRCKAVSLLHIAVVVLAYQLAGGLAEWGITGTWQAAVQDFQLGWRGMLLQVVAGWWILKTWACYADEKF